MNRLLDMSESKSWGRPKTSAKAKEVNAEAALMAKHQLLTAHYQ